MADIGAVEVTLDLRRLIGGTVAIPQLTLIDPKLKLARDAQGTGNWDFPNLQGDPPQEGDGSPNLPEIGHIEVRGGEVAYRDDGLNIQVASTVNTERNEQGEDRVRMVADGNYANEPFHLDATTGTFLALRDRQTPFPVRAEASVGTTEDGDRGHADRSAGTGGHGYRRRYQGSGPLRPVPHRRIPGALDSAVRRVGPSGTSWQGLVLHQCGGQGRRQRHRRRYQNGPGAGAPQGHRQPVIQKPRL